MLMDKQLLLSDQQDLAVAAGAHLSTNTIDLGAPGTNARGTTLNPDRGAGKVGELVVQVTETFTSGGAATLQVQVVEDDAANLGTYTVINESPAIALATLKAGYQFRVALTPGIRKRYLGIRYVVATAAMTNGAVTAGIVSDRQLNGL